MSLDTTAVPEPFIKMMMKFKYGFLLLFMACCTGYVTGQVGRAGISAPPVATSNVGTNPIIAISALPVCMPGSVSCSQAFTYTFIGSGNWTIETNWKENAIPPAVLPTGATIIIDPVPGGECVLNTSQTIAPGAAIKIKAGKKLKLPVNLHIQN